jgi:hypothetical protein
MDRLAPGREEGSSRGGDGPYRWCDADAAVGRVAVAFPAGEAAGAATAADTSVASGEERRMRPSSMGGMIARARPRHSAAGW